jgi:diguanylate cyclase (GGDEF)-like protein
MERILIVEDNTFLQTLIAKAIGSRLGFGVVCVATLAETKEILESGMEHFTLSVLDLNLPDAPDGQVVDYVVSKHIPSIVLTGNFRDDIREKIMAKGVIDYLLKDDDTVIDYLISLIRNIDQNKETKVIVVDDSNTMRTYVSKLLFARKYNVISAKDGADALKKLEQHLDVVLIITDYQMPNLDGMAFIKSVRKRFKRNHLAIIGMSSYGSGSLSARFLKSGANDFVKKPFLEEEFYCRVEQNVGMIRKIKEIEENSKRDYLTGLYNRRYLFDVGTELFESFRRGDIRLAVGLIDIDHFKSINDAYGHDVGDEVLKDLAETLLSRFKGSDIVARYGGEEFCILATGLSRNHSKIKFEAMRRAINEKILRQDGRELRYTVTVGLCDEVRESLYAMISDADAKLYEGKCSGRNVVVTGAGHESSMSPPND